MGAVPLLGLGPACLALRLHRQVEEETGEPAGPAGLNACYVAFFILAAALLCADQPGLVLTLGFLLTALQGYLVCRHYCRTELAEWNPARHLLFWGAYLGLAGLNLSFIIFLLAIWAMFHDL